MLKVYRYEFIDADVLFTQGVTEVEVQVALGDRKIPIIIRKICVRKILNHTCFKVQ